jgi:hypothetical protein
MEVQCQWGARVLVEEVVTRRSKTHPGTGR